jgi:hypothetical protein
MQNGVTFLWSSAWNRSSFCFQSFISFFFFFFFFTLCRYRGPQADDPYNR